MSHGARWWLRLPRQSFRALSTRHASNRGPRGALRRASPAPNISGRERTPDSKSKLSDPPTKVQAVSSALSQQPEAENNLSTPVHIPEDPHGVLKETHPATSILANSAIVIQRQLEMMNVLIGFEQANKYVIMDPHGNHIGYLAEQDHGLGSTMTRQMFRTHRSFTTHVFDKHEQEVLRFHRPFSWISSKIRVYDTLGGGQGSYTSSGSLQGTSVASAVNQSATQTSSLPLSEIRIIGSAEQQWAPLRRKYNLFLARDLETSPASPGTPQLSSGDLPLSDSKALQTVQGDPRQPGFIQFARVDEPFLSWDFSLRSEDGRFIGSVNRNFVGFAREVFTDTGVYALRMDAAGSKDGAPEQARSLDDHPGMRLDERAVMLATAVSIDFDYFSRHSSSGGGMFFPMWMPWFGGEAAGAAGGAAEAGAVGGETAGGIATEAGAAARGVGMGEAGGMAAGAGTMAGYEAMQRSRGAMSGEGAGQDMAPQSHEQSPQAQGGPGQEEVWGQTEDPWGTDHRGPDDWRGPGDGGNGDGEGYNAGDDGDDWF